MLTDMKKQSKIRLHLPGDDIIDITPYVIEVESSAIIQEWEFYMRRGSRYYFKNIWTGNKINILAPELKNLKYGEVYELKFDVE